MPRKVKPPQKPYPGFPLFLHRTGQWAKKVRGKTVYFGTDADAALKKWLAERDDRFAGRTPRSPEGLTVRILVNQFLTSKRLLVDSGELSPRTWSDYYACCESLVTALGKNRRVDELGSRDFELLRAGLAKRRGPVSLGNEIQRIRTLFKFAFDDGLIEKPVRFGATFKKPSRKVIRSARHAAGPRMIEAEDLRKLIGGAGSPLKAMILLGLNCGFGQTDLATLPISAIAGDWITFPRPKTSIPRRCPLWPETSEALREALQQRPTPRSGADSGTVFITKYGKRWVRTNQPDKTKPAVPIDMIQNEFQKLLTANGINRHGLGFYALRHVFRTVADGSKDQPAIDHIMGHARDDMASLYRERIDDERLQAVVDVVRKWLLPNSK